MVGQRFKQINNLIITADVDAGVYHVYAPNGKEEFIHSNIEEVLRRCNECTKYLKKNNTQNIELLYKLTDKVNGYHFPDAAATLKRIKPYTDNGFKLFVNLEPITYSTLVEKIKKDLKTPTTITPFIKYYPYIKEYVDTKGKKYYIKLGEIQTENMM